MTKHKFLTLLVALACTISISGINIDGIEYDIDSSKLTATVTCGYYPLTGMPAPIYSGDIIIPSSIIYEDQTYPVTAIGYYAFMDCSDLTSVTIPYSVTTIEDGAFAGCSKLKNVYYTDLFQGPSFPTYQIPSTARITCKYPINVTTIDEEICACTVLLTIPDIYYERYDEIGLSSNKSATAMYNAADKNGQINFTDGPFSSKNYYLYAKKGTEYVYKDAIQVSTALPTLSYSSSSMLTSITFSNISASTDESVQTLTKGIKFNGQYYEVDEKDQVFLPNLHPGQSYIIYLYGCYNGTYYEQFKTVSTKTPSLSCSSSATQTTITLSNISASTDTSVHSLSKGIYYNYKRYEADENNKVVITGIVPNTKCTLQVYGCYNGNYYYGTEKYVTTKSLAPTITTQVTPTCIYAQGSYTHGDATILGSSMACTTTGSSVIGDEGLMTGLKPNTDYLFTYSVDTKEGGTYTATKTITTSDLELTTLTPKVVSAGNVVVAASTNISDYETNVGFEWRKYNAPPELPSSRAQAILYSGQMEGILHNLSLEYWKVRAYYEAADGTCYYGEWATFDPSQPAYFEPTVHTYAMATSPTGNQVQVRGYVMTGTDEVTEQGFEYWFNSGQKVPNRMPAATPDSIYRVTASGQVMTAVLKDLAYSTTYTCRAYAVADGKTYYGEEVQFLTPEDTRPIYTLTLDAGIGGQVNLEAAGQYREGEQVTLRATADKGYVFVQWSDLNTENPRTITITSDITLSAIFEENQPQNVENVVECDPNNVNKSLRNGQVIIRQGNKTYNVVGQEL